MRFYLHMSTIEFDMTRFLLHVFNLQCARPRSVMNACTW